jgi:fumarate hydratase subunit alpha/L(+)-tartrate dehydratase alpha subunit
MTVVTTDLDAAVADAAAHLYVWALKDIPQDLATRSRDAAGRETSVTGSACCRRSSRTSPVAEDEKNLVCQDTGSPSTTARSASTSRCTRPRSTPRSGGNRARDGRASAALEHRAHADAREHRAERRLPRPDRALGLRPDWDGLDVKCVPKGSGSENMSFLKMCVPADG